MLPPDLPAGSHPDRPADFPADMPGFLARFGNDDACRDYLFARRWPDGFRCPRCDCRRCYRLERRIVYECSACGFQHALLAGTIFEQTKTPLSRWFLACYLFLASKGGVSALELKRHLGFKSDQTAWSWLHKLRAAMGPRGERLRDPVEVGATPLGGPAPGEPGRGHGHRAPGKTLVAGAVEVRTAVATAPDPERLSGAARARAIAMARRLEATGGEVRRRRLDRLRLAAAGSASQPDRFAAAAIAAAVEPADAIARAGSAAGCEAAGAWAVDAPDAALRGHAGGADTAALVAETGVAPAHSPAIHLVFMLARRLLAGTYHGGVGRHLPRYLDELAFRFDRKRLGPIERVASIIDRALGTAPVTLQMIFSRNLCDLEVVEGQPRT